MSNDYDIKIQYSGKPFINDVLTVYVYEDEAYKAKIMQTIERFKWLVSINAFVALIYEFENGDVLQYCGGKENFILEYIKMVEETPNIRRIKMNSKKELTEMNGYYYGDNYCEIIESDVVSSTLMSKLIAYTINSDKSNWLEFLDGMCRKHNTYTDSYIMTSKGFTKISIINLKHRKHVSSGFLCNECGKVIFIPKCNICKKRPFTECSYYNCSKVHSRYRGVISCEGFEEDETSLSYKQYKELETEKL